MSQNRPADALHDKPTATSNPYREEELFSQLHEALTWDNIQRYLPLPGSRILDAGGGSGRWAVRLARMGYHVTLTDVLTGLPDAAQRRLDVKGLLDRVIIERMDIRDMTKLAHDSFNLAMAHDVLSYCGEPQRTVGELVRVTRPGGHVIVSAESRIAATQEIVAGNWEQAERILATGQATTKQPPPAQVVRFFDIDEMVTLFEQENLQVVRVFGRAILTERLSPETRRSILQNSQALSHLIELEIRHADNPGWAGAAQHFEIVGLKKEESSVKLFRQVWSR